MTLTIRQAVLSDYKQVNELVKEVHKLHVIHRPDVYVGLEQPLAFNYFEELIESPDIKIWVVEDQAQTLVAYSIVRRLKPSTLLMLVPSTIDLIDDFCVKATHRKQGIGKQLLEHLIRQSKSCGATSLQLNVWEFNETAILFYESLGMRTRNRRMELTL